MVDCALKPQAYTVHINGWMDLGNSSQFHGKVLRQSVYDLSGCQACHGEELTGGTSGVACTSCHVSPIGSCNTCHGSAANAAPPLDLNYNSATSLITVGAHQTHVTDGGMHTAFPCQVCHNTPATPGDEGHYQSGGKLLPGPAPVIGAADYGGSFSWNSTAATCTNGYCHAPVADSNAAQINPSCGLPWARTRPTAAPATGTLRPAMGRTSSAIPATVRPSPTGNRARRSTATVR